MGVLQCHIRLIYLYYLPGSCILDAHVIVRSVHKQCKLDLRSLNLVHSFLMNRPCTITRDVTLTFSFTLISVCRLHSCVHIMEGIKCYWTWMMRFPHTCYCGRGFFFYLFFSGGLEACDKSFTNYRGACNDQLLFILVKPLFQKEKKLNIAA